MTWNPVVYSYCTHFIIHQRYNEKRRRARFWGYICVGWRRGLIVISVINGLSSLYLYGCGSSMRWPMGYSFISSLINLRHLNDLQEN